MMALKLSPIAFHFRSHKLPSFALPQMASLASPKFVMPSTLPASKAFPKKLFAVCALSSEITGISTSEFGDFSVTTSGTGKTNELKVSIEVSGAKTRVIFDDVFSKMVADAQPIPGFRRVKGGKTPNIPEDVLLQVLGPSRVFKEVIQKVINSTVAEYVEKEGLTVGKDLRVEQSIDDLEAAFEPGDEFNFDAVVQLLQGNNSEP